jgi:glycosyltransferase involved in cell wall biosynthesis
MPTLSSGYGGPVNAVLGMAAAQARAGLNVRLISTDDKYEPNGNAPAFEVKTYPCRIKSWHWSPQLGNALREAVRWSDVVTIHTLWSYPTFSASRACRDGDVPYVLRPAGMLDQWSLAQKRLKKSLYAKFIEARTINGAAAIWFTSEEEQESARLFNHIAPGFVIPLGVALQEYVELPAKGAFREQFNIGPDRRMVLFLGRLAPGKRPDLVLRSFAAVNPEFQDAVLVIAGPDERGSLAKLQTLAHELGIRDRVVFTGKLTRDQVVAANNDADVFVLPSLHESFGVAVIEAMAAGCPVIVSDKVALASWVTKSEAGVVVDVDEAALIQTLRHILGNPDLRIEMGRRGREVALTRFTWEAIVPGLVAEYELAISSSRRKH